jgi:hypothetical protein
VAFWRAGGSWFPASPATRWLVALLALAMVVLAWPHATRRVWRLAVHSMSVAALVLVALEMGLGAAHPREREPSRYPYPYRMHGFAPNQRAAHNAYQASTNDAGLREPGPIALAKPDGTLRVVVLGGSAMFGIGAEDGGSAPDHLERLLADAPRPPGISRIEVVNAGQGWYNSTQELVYFLTELWRYEPDLVLVVDGYNDLHHSLVWGVPPPQNAVAFDAVNRMRVSPGFFEDAGWEHAVAAGVWASALRRKLGIPPERLFAASTQLGAPGQRLAEPAAAEQEVFRALVANWSALDATAERRGFRVHFALQPVIYTKQPLLPAEAAFLEGARDYAPAVGAAWLRLEAYVAREAESLGLDVFASDTYVRRSGESLFLDYCHLESEGYQQVARAMAEVVLRDLASFSAASRRADRSADPG